MRITDQIDFWPFDMTGYQHVEPIGNQSCRKAKNQSDQCCVKNKWGMAKTNPPRAILLHFLLFHIYPLLAKNHTLWNGSYL